MWGQLGAASLGMRPWVHLEGKPPGHSSANQGGVEPASGPGPWSGGPGQHGVGRVQPSGISILNGAGEGSWPGLLLQFRGSGTFGFIHRGIAVPFGFS